MTTCPRCGQPNRPGSPVCMRCGQPLTSAQPIPDGADDGLPPWLRELQGAPAPTAGYPQPPAPSYAPRNGAGGYQPQSGNLPPQTGYGQPQQQNMQASDLVNADALPEWLRAVASGPLSGPAYPAPPASAGWGPQAGFGQPGASAGMQYAPYAGNGAGPAVSGPLMSGPLGTGQAGFGQPASTLFDESALPDWLRQASMGQEIEGAAPTHPVYGMSGGLPGRPNAYVAPEASPNGYQAPPSAQPPVPRYQPSPQASQASAFPSLDQAGAYRPAPPSDAGISGRSLLDTGALPGWLGGQPGPNALAPNGMPTNAGGMSAQSLVDESALPQWLRAEPAGPATPNANGYGKPNAAGIPPSPAPQVASSWLSAPASAEPLPQWLNQVYADANVPRVEPRPAGAPIIGGNSGNLGTSAYSGPNAGVVPGSGLLAGTGGTVSASDFVDESALPDWLKSQGAVADAPAAVPSQQAYSPPGVPMRPASAGLPDRTVPEHRAAPMYRPAGEPAAQQPSRFAASDLIDPSALPAWVTAQNPAPEPTFSSATGWTVKQPVVPTSRQNDPMDAGTGYGSTVSRGDGTGGLRRGDPGESSWQNQSSLGEQYAAGGADAQQSGGRYSQQYARMPYESQQTDGYRGMAGPAPHGGAGAGKRRGPPIPSEELPPWLQGAGSARGDGELYGDEDRYGDPNDNMSWDDDAEAAPQWNDWGDEGFGGDNGYARQDEYAEYDYDEPAQEQRGGWRRFFGRK